MELITSIAKREASRNEFGYGIGIASHYLKSVASCMGDEECMARSLGGSVSPAVWATMLKEAEARPTYINDEMTFGEKATSTDGFKEILKRCKSAMPPEVPKHCAMVFSHVITTTKMDRDRDIMETEGANVDPRAPFLWQHIPVNPIGKHLGIEQQDKMILKAVSCILDINTLCGDAIKFIEADVLRISHGFRPKKFEAIPDTVGSQVPNGFRVKEYDVVEVSGVSVPANADAIITLYSRKSLQHDLTKAYAKKFYDARPAMVASGIDILKLDAFEAGGRRFVAETKSTSCSCGDSPVSTNKAAATTEEKKPCASEEMGDGKEKKKGKCESCGCDLVDGKCEKCEGMKAGRFSMKMFTGADGKAELRAEPAATGEKLYAAVEDSYEWVRDNLQGQVKSYLIAKQAIVEDEKSYNYCYIEATLPGNVIVAAEQRGKQTYYQIGWKKVDGFPKLDGDVSEVKVQASVITKSFGEHSLGRRYAFSTSKAARVLSEKNVARLHNALDYQSKASQSLTEIKADHESNMKKREEAANSANRTLVNDPVEASPSNSVVSGPVDLGKSLAAHCISGAATIEELEGYKALIENTIEAKREDEVETGLAALLDLG
jgi:hypothetical protein